MGMRRTPVKTKRNGTSVKKREKVVGNQMTKWNTHSRTRVPRVLYASEFDVQIPFHDETGSALTATFFGAAYKINSLAEAGFTYLGLSNFNAIYKRYRVIAVDCSVTTHSAHATITQMVSSLITNSATAPASSAIVINNGLNPGGRLTVLGLGAGGHDICVQRHRFKVQSFEGSVEVETADTFAAATSAVADPANLLYLQVGATDIFGTSITFSIRMLIHGTMWVRYFDAVQQ